MKRDWISKRALKKMAARVELPEYVPDVDNMRCIQGGAWDAPNGATRTVVLAAPKGEWASE